MARKKNFLRMPQSPLPMLHTKHVTNPPSLSATEPKMIIHPLQHTRPVQPFLKIWKGVGVPSTKKSI